MSSSKFSIASTIEADKAVQVEIASRPIKATIRATADTLVEVSQSARLIAKTLNEELKTNLMDTKIANIIDMKATADKHGISIVELQELRASL